MDASNGVSPVDHRRRGRHTIVADCALDDDVDTVCGPSVGRVVPTRCEWGVWW